MVGVDQSGDVAADVRFVGVSSLHQSAEAAEEGVGVEGNRGTDMDEVVVGLPEALLLHQLFFIELFTRAQTGILDSDIHIRPEAGELDEVAGEGVDLHRRAHVEDKDLAAVGIGAGLHDKRDSLLDGHEIADDIGMGDRDGAALLDLFFKDGDDRAVGAQDIAEAHSHELGPCMLKGLCRDGVVGRGMGEKRGNRVCLAGLDLFIKGLDDHLAEALAGAHDVGGVDGLVGGDEDKALAAVKHGGISRAVGAEGVVLDRLAGAVLHEGDMLVGSGVIDDLWTVGAENLVQAAAVADRADERDKVQVGILLAQLQLDSIGVVLVDIENHQLFGVVRGDLAAELGANGAAAAGDQDGLAGDEGKNLFHIRLNRLAAEEVFHGDVLHGGHADLILNQLIDAGKLFELAAGLAADRKDLLFLFAGGAGDGKIDLVDLILLNSWEDVLAAADNGNAVDIAVPLVGVVVDDADDPVVRPVGLLDIAEDHLAGGAGADEHDTCAGRLGRAVQPAAQELDKTV